VESKSWEYTPQEGEKSMPKEARTYTHEFKLEAVRLVETSGKSMSQVARDLGIADSTLHRLQ